MKRTIQTAPPKKAHFVAVRLTDGEVQALDLAQAVTGLKTRSEVIREAIGNLKNLDPQGRAGGPSRPEPPKGAAGGRGRSGASPGGANGKERLRTDEEH